MYLQQIRVVYSRKGHRNMQEAQHEIKKSLEALFCTHREYQMNLGLLAPCNLIYWDTPLLVIARALREFWEDVVSAYTSKRWLKIDHKIDAHAEYSFSWGDLLKKITKNSYLKRRRTCLLRKLNQQQA